MDLLYQMESSKLYPYTHGQVTLDKGARAI